MLSCFITLTYDDDHLPADRSLDLDHFQRFMKRLRKKHGAGIRFFHCGEYGEKFGRPHYHALIFNHDFADKKPWKKRGEVTLYTSVDLQGLWPYGFCSVGAVTLQSAGYVARYIMKKVTGPRADDHYEYVNPETGEVTQRRPEYVTMSRRPGIGARWFEQFRDEVFPGDFVVVDGRKARPPRFYDNLLEALSEVEHEAMVIHRRRRAAAHRENVTPERLAVREKCTSARVNRLVRDVE